MKVVSKRCEQNALGPTHKSCYTNKRTAISNLRRPTKFIEKLFIIICIGCIRIVGADSNEITNSKASNIVLSDENFTFAHNGSFIQLDAGREWPFNSKREISFKFRTRSPHGLLIYQTFDHNKLIKDDDQENVDLLPVPPQAPIPIIPVKTSQSQGKQQSDSKQPSVGVIQADIDTKELYPGNSREFRSTRDTSSTNAQHRARRIRDNLLVATPPLVQLSSNSITATASQRLVNSLFSSSPASAINGNNKQQTPLRGGPKSASDTISNMISSKESGSALRNSRLLSNFAHNSETSNNRVTLGARQNIANNDGSTILSSSTISSYSASLYELYLKLENGRLKIMYEFGSRLNQTYCGKGLNDDRWHKVELKVDPELNQMILILDQMITVEIVLSQTQQDDDAIRRNELVFTNSILYLGGLDNNASIVKNVRQRLYTAQFIGCIGQIMFKTDQLTEANLQPAAIDRLVLIRRGCVNKCETNNYCLHKSTCVNYYTHTKCDCFGTNYEDIYCWQDKLTTLTMLGYSNLVYRIYDWRDRHHSSINRLSMQFKTLALDSILFFAYGDSSPQQNFRNHANNLGQTIQSTLIQSQSPLVMPQVNLSNPITIHRPIHQHQPSSNTNYLSVALSNGTIIVEVNFGDQPIILSNLLYDKVYNRSAHLFGTGPTSNYYRPLSLSDGRWHNVTFIHNNKQLFLHVDNYLVNYTISSKSNHLYFDPSIYVGGVPNLLLNETRLISKPFNLRHKFVGCLRSVHFNQHNLLLALKQGSPMADYRDPLGRARLNSCITQDPNSLPLTMRSGKSYLTFRLTPNSQLTTLVSSSPRTSDFTQSTGLDVIRNTSSSNSTSVKLKPSNTAMPIKKLTKIEFEYKTSLQSHFLAGGYLKDSNYHDLGGFWTLHASDNCQLYFTISSGLTYDPEQVIKIDSNNTNCDPKSWFKISISMISGDKILNVTRSKVSTISKFEDEYMSPPFESIDELQRSYTLRSSVELLHQVQLGGDLAKFGESSSVPFAGCIRRIKINGHLFDSRDFVTSSATISPMMMNSNQSSSSFALTGGSTRSDTISSRMAQGYVTLDSCQLVNPCLTLNPCKNNGICKINELGEPDCDCSKTGYSGKRCQFSIYKQSCLELYLSGQRKSSYYVIDLDRNGPLRPVRVRCNMDEGSDHIETVLTHNLPPEYLIRKSSTKDVQLDIVYMAFHHMYTYDGFYIHDDTDEVSKNNQDSMLRSLISQSIYCRQYFRYECRAAPLELGNKTWMEAPYPKNHKLTSLDGLNHGKCMCATTEKKCLDPNKNCNCDSGESIWTDDSFDLLGHEDVGLTKIVILKQDSFDPVQAQQQQVVLNRQQQTITNLEPQSRFTLSDLKCYGARQHVGQHEITFKTSDAYIEVPGWRRGDISFSFRTASNPPAIILYQLATSRNHGYFRLTLISDTRLLFEFIVNRKPKKIYLSSSHKLNNGEWQQVFIEYDMANLRLTVNDDTSLVDLDTNDHLGTFEGPLFIGGAPSKYLVGDLSKRNGFTGCFRALTIDGHSIDLKSYLSPSMPTVTSACKPSCTKNLCQNGGKCIEYWGSYECECSNPIAHSGSNCEINLNTNSITFVTQESHYVQLFDDSLNYPPYLIKNVLLNVRTYQETALILYASDHLNNFIQLHKNGSSLVLTFNSNSTIITVQVPIDEEHGSSLSKSSQTIGQLAIQVNPDSIFTPTVQSIDLSAANAASGPPAGNPNSVLNMSNKQSQSISEQATNYTLQDKSIRTSNTSGSGQPIQVKIERHRLRTTFYVNNNFVTVEKPMVFLTNYTQNPWLNPELELVRPTRPKIGSKMYPQLFLANVDNYHTTRLPGFTGCIQGLSIDNQLFDFNRAHLTGEFKGDYKIGCKMHCDSFPCKNQGTCIENWKEDGIQCKCDTTSYVGRLCDEDIAAIFNGQTSFFLYHLSKKLSLNQPPVVKAKLNPQENVLNSTLATNLTNVFINDEPALDPQSSGSIEINDGLANYFEISLAFSTDMSNRTVDSSSMQVLVLITQANSSKHFFLGLTHDGSLLIQEDYGNSMSLSRLIKRPEQSYNDGFRHMIKYTRYNQTMQIMVDHQNYLPTLSVVTSNHVNRHSKTSVILVGTVGDRSSGLKLLEDIHFDSNYTNYSGCISNLIIKMEQSVIEPLSEAFGQNLETIKINSAKGSLESFDPTPRTNEDFDKRFLSSALQTQEETLNPQESYPLSSSTYDKQMMHSKTLSIINKLSGKEVIDDMETIVARDVEQGKCAPFKKVDVVNEKRSVNEPKFTPFLESRPVYMDPPRIKPYRRIDVVREAGQSFHKLNAVFYCSAAILAIVGSSSLIYAYTLQMHYKSEKFRCETPFFHKRDETTGSESVSD